MENTRILIVEDEMLTAENIRFELANLGYEDLDIAMFGVEAVEKAQKLRPDLVLMDIKLPGRVDGISAAEQIRSRFDIPVVYLTAYVDDETLRRAKVSEPFGYVLKPFRVDALQSAIEMALYRHRTDRRLKESEARYRAIVEDQNELICRFLPDGTLTFVNGAYCRYFGQDCDDLVGKKVMSGVLQEDREWVREQYLPLLPEQPVASYEHRVRKPNGEIRWQRWGTRAIFDEQARLIEFQAVGRDITRRKRAESEREKLIIELQEALARVNTLSGLLPICASCKKIRDDQGYWTQVEVYIRDHSDARFSHGICPDCARELYPGFYRSGE